ncbi:hypothetical protein ACF0H5_022280 [Mactra antiquata]
MQDPQCDLVQAAQHAKVLHGLLAERRNDTGYFGGLGKRLSPWQLRMTSMRLEKTFERHKRTVRKASDSEDLEDTDLAWESIGKISQSKEDVKAGAGNRPTSDCNISKEGPEHPVTGSKENNDLLQMIFDKLESLSKSGKIEDKSVGNSNGNNRNGKIITCYNCQEKGHISRNCPKKNTGNSSTTEFRKHGYNQRHQDNYRRNWQGQGSERSGSLN